MVTVMRLEWDAKPLSLTSAFYGWENRCRQEEISAQGHLELLNSNLDLFPLNKVASS